MTWVNRSWSLICLERPDQFAHGRSFPLSDSLKVAHLSWAIWTNCSQSLIWFERNERNEWMSKWAMSEWANSQPWFVKLKLCPFLACDKSCSFPLHSFALVALYLKINGRYSLLSLFTKRAIHSHHFLQKELLTPITFYKKSHSLPSLFTKRAIHSCHSLQKSEEPKSDWLLKSDSLVLRVGVEEKTSNVFFSPSFSPCYAQNKRVNRSCRSFKKRD